VLGSVLLDNAMLLEVIPILESGDFYRDTHETIYRSIRELFSQGKPVDAITLAEDLISRGAYESIGGDEALSAILGSVPHAANAKYYAGIVHELAVRRRLIQHAEQSLREAYDRANDKTAAELLADAERRLFSIGDAEAKGSIRSIREIGGEWLDRLHDRLEGRVFGVPTGMIDFDGLAGGLPEGSLAILAGRPSMGKTAFALNILENAVRSDKGVLCVSLEMGDREVMGRLLVSASCVSGHKVLQGTPSAAEICRLGAAYDWYAQRDHLLELDANPVRTMSTISANARRFASRRSLDLVIVDYVQLIEPETTGESRQEQVSKISRRLKAMARELKVPVLALSQLSRAVEHRDDRRPRMADLRESGALEQDADLVLLLHRPEYYDPADQPGIAELIVAKNRNGRTGTVRLAWRKDVTRFESLSHSEQATPGAF
jgi:replicative DNA helicase